MKYKGIFGIVHQNVKKYDQSIAVSGSGLAGRGYANPTAASAQKKKTNRSDNDEFSGAFLHELWSNLQNSLK